VRWDVPVRRGEFEARWLETASVLVPPSVPKMLGYEPHSHLIGMQFFAPEEFPNWRSQIMHGHVDRAVASSLGHIVGTIHAATADRPDIRTRFDSDSLFDALRLDPYFRSLRSMHPDLAERLDEIIERTATTRRVLVHGDVSPKNVLVGKAGPILLDAECAWFGDPAFDVAFLCTHLLLKARVKPTHATELRGAFADYINAYESHVNWESLSAIQERSADLLAAMLLARIDGKSPVDYLPQSSRNWVRSVARDLLNGKSASPIDVLNAWSDESGEG
jgi:aminoglycoside phosphotransferase (APT) family kinase protein